MNNNLNCFTLIFSKNMGGHGSLPTGVPCPPVALAMQNIFFVLCCLSVQCMSRWFNLV